MPLKTRRITNNVSAKKKKDKKKLIHWWFLLWVIRHPPREYHHIHLENRFLFLICISWHNVRTTKNLSGSKHKKLTGRTSRGLFLTLQRSLWFFRLYVKTIKKFVKFVIFFSTQITVGWENNKKCKTFPDKTLMKLYSTDYRSTSKQSFALDNLNLVVKT